MYLVSNQITYNIYIKSGILPQSKKCLVDPFFFDRAIRSAHPVEKVDFFNGMRGSDCSSAKLDRKTF